VQTPFRLATACTLSVVVLTASACTSAPVRVEGPAAARANASVPPLNARANPTGVRSFVGRLPLAFEPNVGQADAGIRYVSRAPGMRVELTEQGARLAATRANGHERVVSLRLVGGHPAAVITAEDELPGKVHYFAASDPSSWRTNIATYRRIVYRNVYAGTHLVFHGAEGAVEFDFVVAPGADPRAIGLDVTGADAVTLDGGDVVLRLGDDSLRVHQPVVYQHTPSGRVVVVGHMRLDGHRLGFEVGEYDRTRPLVIDPVVTYSTYYGGSASDTGFGIGVDASANIYVALGDSGGNRLIKLSADGQTLLYSAVLGDARPAGLVVDATGNAYVLASCPYPRSGITFACPTLNGLTTGHAQAQGDSGSYVLKFNPTGSLVFGTSMGGIGSVIPGGIAIDAGGNIYATAWDVYDGFPLTRPAFATPAGAGGFHTVVEAIAADTSRFLYVVEFQTGNTFFAPRGIAVDRAGAAYVTGMITASTFPTTPGVFQPNDAGFGGGVVAKIAPDGSLAYATYFGNNMSATNNINPTAIAADADGNAYIAGWVGSGPGLPTVNAIQPAMAGGAKDAFVARLDPTGSSLVFSTYLGGSGEDAGTGTVALGLDASANVYVAGTTSSIDFPQLNPLPLQFAHAGGNFVAQLTSDGSALVYSTYFADSGTAIYALTVTATGTVYLTGSATTTGYPTVLPYQAAYGGAGDAFIARLEPSEPRVFITNPADGATVGGTVWTDVWVENYVGTSNTVTLSVGSTVVATGTATNHATLAWDSRAIADGTITLTATVTDTAGHVGTRTRSLVVHNGTTPTLTAGFTSPADGATVSGTVTIGMSAGGSSGTPITFTLTVDATQVFTATGTATTASFNLDTSTMSAGPHTLGVTVRDGAGRTASASRTVSVAGSSLSLTASFTSPGDGATVSGTVLVGMAEAGANGTPISFTLTVDGSQVFTTSGTAATASFNWNTSAVAPGTHALGLTVRDGAGRTATASRSVTVTGASPAHVYITQPGRDGATVSGTTWIVLWSDGTAAGTKTYSFSVGGGTVATTNDTSSGPISLAWDTRSVPDGAQTVTATVRDSAGNVGVATRSVTVSNGGTPTLAASFTSPTSGAAVSGSVSVDMSATGANGTPIAFTLTVDGTQVFATSGSAASASFSWNTTTVGDGSHTLSLTVRDGAGRTATATRPVSVTNTTPPPPPPGSISVFITQPRTGSTVSGTVWFTIWIENAAAGSKTYTLTEGGRTLGTTTTTSNGPVSIPWATTAADNGARTPAVGVRDASGATGTGSTAVTVAN
jgi:Bacterial Ig domain/Beta-propeller repeat